MFIAERKYAVHVRYQSVNLNGLEELVEFANRNTVAQAETHKCSSIKRMLRIVVLILNDEINSMDRMIRPCRFEK